MIAAVATLAATAIGQSSPALSIMFPSPGLAPATAARMAATGSKAYAVVGPALDPTGRGFATTSAKEVATAIKSRFSRGTMPEYAVIDLGPSIIASASKARTDEARQPAGVRMASLVKELKSAFPGTKWSWRGLPTSKAPSGTSWTDEQYRELASSVDWLCPDNIVAVAGTAPSLQSNATGANATVAARAWSPGRPVIASISQWIPATERHRAAQALAPRFVLMTNRALLDGPVASARTAGADGIMFTHPAGMPPIQITQSASSMSAAITAIRAQSSKAPAISAPPATMAEAPGPTARAPSPPAPPPPSGVRSATPRVSAETATFANAALAAIPRRLLQPFDGNLVLRSTDWGAIYDRSLNSPTLSNVMGKLNRMAEVAYAQPPSKYIRPRTFEQIPQEMLYRPTLGMEPIERRDLHQLAIVDTIQTNFLLTQGVALAIVAHRTRNAEYISRCIEMLEAINQYRPLQRTGYTYGNKLVPMTADGDGVWLATASGIDAIVEMLRVLKDDVPAELRARLEMQLRDEVLRISRDWAERKPWFVRSRKAQSNQWIELNVALVKACLFLGDPGLKPAYELGAENIAATLAALGADGSFNEGLAYAEMSVGRLHESVRLMRGSGDLRCSGSSFVRRNWFWFIHMHMPGGMLINAFDASKSWLPDGDTSTPMASMGLAAMATDDQSAMPMLKWMFPRQIGNYSLEAIQLVAELDGISSPPQPRFEPFAVFPDQGLVVWRSAFEPLSSAQTAWGLWIRGGNPTNNHCHRDQGHVSVCNAGKPVLIEAGAGTAYETAEYESYYSAAAGHSTLQVGALQPNGQSINAPITVEALDPAGGSTTIDCTAAFPGTTRFVRKVEWTRAGRVDLEDTLTLRQAATAGTELFRFHTGSEDRLVIARDGVDWTVSWQGATLRFVATAPIMVEQQQMADSVTRGGRHQAILVKTAANVDSLVLSTSLNVVLESGQ
jgi:hypothetical protein